MTEEQGAALEAGDIVQITKPERPWFPALLIVDEVRSWGVLACCLVPRSNGQPADNAYTRLKWDEIDRVGRAVFMSGTEGV